MAAAAVRRPYGVYTPPSFNRRLPGLKTRGYKPPSAEPCVKRVLTNLTHGGSADSGRYTKTPFDYLFDDIVGLEDKHLPATDTTKTTGALKALGIAMALQANEEDSSIPAIYTYWGQFVDHDMTANTDKDGKIAKILVENPVPLSPKTVKTDFENARLPALNLDSVYGDGPFEDTDVEFVPYNGIKLEIGKVDETIAGNDVIPTKDFFHDLPRVQNSTPENNGVAQTGDGRNDENLIVAQLHVVFLRFHNAAVDWVKTNEPELKGEKEIFARARDLTRWSYQWITVNDFLKTVALKRVVDSVLSSNNILRLGQRGTYMPLEFSVAAYRFGHSMIRGGYNWNRNFGRAVTPGKEPILRFASLDLLFRFTGKGEPDKRLQPGQTPPGEKNVTRLPLNWIAEWSRMVNTDQDNRNFARKINTQIVPPLNELPNEGGKGTDFEGMLKQLPVRNLLRGYVLSLPTGQAVAEKLHVDPLTQADLEKNTSNEIKKALEDGGFFTHTPLWFYILKEAEIGGGESLGEVGSLIVASTIIGHILHDKESYLNQKGWSPEKGVTLKGNKPVKTIIDFLTFAGVLEQ